MFDEMQPTAPQRRKKKSGNPIQRAKLDTVEARLTALAERHAALDTAIAEEMRHIVPDDVKLRRLKRAKLRLKDDMAFLTGLTRTLSRGARETLPAA
ncbi:MAG: YdcH family protein [Pseudomonadota bacterium]